MLQRLVVQVSVPTVAKSFCSSSHLSLDFRLSIARMQKRYNLDADKLPIARPTNLTILFIV